ncbi:MAG: DEAD/DEAH box helicase [Pseudomonadales bacterium]
MSTPSTETATLFSEISPANPLQERLLKALEKLGFETPTPVQAQSIPPALAGKDLLVNAETGSGKTAAFLLPLLNKLLASDAPNTGTRALILVPTRELARQVLKQCEALASFTPLKTGLIIGRENFQIQKALFRKNPEILVATPGRLMEHLDQNTPDFNDLEVLVLDEADRMLDMGFGEDVLKIATACNPQRQTLLYSATLTGKGLKPMIDKVLREPEELLLNTARDANQAIRQQVILADDNGHKQKLLLALLLEENYDKALIFTNTRAKADSLGELLFKSEVRSGVLHGEMEQEHRNRVVERLRTGHIKALVASDVAARGLDIKGIDLVINFDMARNGDDYLHRIGRTGRAGETGLAISLISDPEWNLMASIERYLGQRFERRLVESLKGHYKGPKKLKASGKAAGTKKKKQAKKEATKKGAKTKVRKRDTQNVGKRRKTDNNSQPQDAGFTPLKKRT